MPPLGATQTFPVTVAEVNAPPSVLPQAPRTFRTGETVTFPVIASDASDLPPNSVTLSLTGLPAGAQLDPVTGEFSWTPSTGQAGEYLVTFLATDDGQPPLSAQTTTMLTVEPPPQPVVLTGAICAAGNFRFRFTTQSGWRYRVQCQTRLGDSEWQDCGDAVDGLGGEVEFAAAATGAGANFYRVLALRR